MGEKDSILRIYYYKGWFFSLHYQISWIFAINQEPCVSSCWRRHTPVVCNESRESHDSHYPSRPVTKNPTDYSYQPLSQKPDLILVNTEEIPDIYMYRFSSFLYFFFSSIRYHGSSSIKCHVYHHVGGRRHTPVVCNESRQQYQPHGWL